ETKPGDSHRAFAKLDFDIIFTTNFDFILENSYRLIGKGIVPIVNEEQLPNIHTNVIVDGNKKLLTKIIKIHGDFNNPKKMILTEDDYDLFVYNNPLMATYISSMLITRTPLFIGYSLD